MRVRRSAQLQVPSYRQSQRLVALLAMVAWGDRCRSSWEDATRGTASAGVRTASWFGNGRWLCGCHCWNSPWLCRTGRLASGCRQGCVGALRWRRGGVAPEVLQGLGGGNLTRPQLLPHLGFWVVLLVWSGLRSSFATYTYSTFYLQINAWCFYPPLQKRGWVRVWASCSAPTAILKFQLVRSGTKPQPQVWNTPGFVKLLSACR